MKKLHFVFLIISIIFSAVYFSHGEGKPLSLVIMHINDTHAHLDPSSIKLRLMTNEQDRTRVEAGGFARIATKISEVRAANKNTLLLHAGDVFSGTLYFTQNLGLADLKLMKYMTFEVMVPGNHEFDKGTPVFADFIHEAEPGLSVVCANIDTSDDKALNGNISQYIIKDYDGEKVAVIGLTTPETPSISSPGDTVRFLNESDSIESVKNIIKKLSSGGVNKFILLTHTGYREDKILAAEIPGIDLIVGGHSHTLLGDFSAEGLNPAGPYPAIVTNTTTGEPVYIVQAWEWGKVFGELDVSFDSDGRIISTVSSEKILIGDVFTRDSKVNSNENYTKDEILQIKKFISGCGTVEIVTNDPKALDILEPYSKSIEKLNLRIIGSADENLSRQALGQIVADSFLWKSRKIGKEARIAFMNRGGIRADIPKGDISVGKIYEVEPFGNTVIIMEMTGLQVKEALEEGFAKGFPYVSGIRYTVAENNPAGQKVISVELEEKDGSTKPIVFSETYLVVTQSFMAGGGDNYGIFKTAGGYRYDTGFVDADVLMEYLNEKKTFNCKDTLRITYQ